MDLHSVLLVYVAGGKYSPTKPQQRHGIHRTKPELHFGVKAMARGVGPWGMAPGDMALGSNGF